MRLWNWDVLDKDGLILTHIVSSFLQIFPVAHLITSRHQSENCPINADPDDGQRDADACEIREADSLIAVRFSVPDDASCPERPVPRKA